LAAAVVVVVVIIVIGAYAIYSKPASTVTSTSTSVATSTAVSTVVSTSVSTAISTSISTSVSTSVSTVSPTGTPLISYSADAYAAEATSLLNGFSSSTGIAVAPLKSGGSDADASAIAAGAPDDVFISSALSATSSQYLGNLTANWTVGFATDQMVVAYSNSTTQSAATTSIINLAKTAESSNATSDWNAFYTALVSGTVKVGISDPTQDPGGLRGWLVLEGAGLLYGSGNSQAYSSVLLKDQDNVTAASAADLVAPLQAGQIQFLFIYKSAAVTDNLNYLVLDPHVNLGTPSLGNYYSRVSYTDSAGVTKGATIVISVTIPLSSTNTAAAVQFVQYVVKNAKSLSSFGLVPLTPCLLYANTPPPLGIQQLEAQGLLATNGALP
jgi:molybdate/tungstate transport system substrate-binding protein